MEQGAVRQSGFRSHGAHGHPLEAVARDQSDGGLCEPFALGIMIDDFRHSDFSAYGLTGTVSAR
jgi:hypothetical protein